MTQNSHFFFLLAFVCGKESNKEKGCNKSLAKVGPNNTRDYSSVGNELILLSLKK